jgi:short-subunit dehydrogenase
VGTLKGRVIAVTGASSGIGAHLAVELAAQGAIPVLIARRVDLLMEVADRIPGEKLYLQADVTDSQQVEQAVQMIIKHYGRIDGWVNNAGAGNFKAVLEMPIEEFEQQLAINYISVVRCTKAVLPHMLKAGQGHIVNVVSVAGKIGTAKSSGYSASKHAALGFTNSLRAELIGTGIRVSSVNPGPIDTPFFDIADPDGSYKKNVEWFMLKPERVAKSICRALSSGKAEITMPWTASAGAKLLQVFPNLLAGVAGKLLNKK